MSDTVAVCAGRCRQLCGSFPLFAARHPVLVNFQAESSHTTLPYACLCARACLLSVAESRHYGVDKRNEVQFAGKVEQLSPIQQPFGFVEFHRIRPVGEGQRPE